MSLLENIKNLQKVNTLSKHEQLVHGIIASINNKTLVVGDKLPSINVMVSDLGYARKTIVKAYEELKDRGLVESKKLKGYFIVSNETNVTLKIALVLFSFQRFQEEFYNAFRKELGDKFQIDVFFHHNNVSVFKSIFNTIKGKYGKYVIAPIPNPTLRPVIESISPDKLLIIDRFIALNNEYSYISQEFEKSTYSKLAELLPKISKYKKFILFFEEYIDHPVGILNAFEKFCAKHNLNGSVEKRYQQNSVEKSSLYFFISDTFLWEVLRDAKHNKYTIGKDVGILSHNDHVVKEIVFGGITTISSDFKEMAVKAANHIKFKKEIQQIVPSHLIRRNSL